MTRLRDTDVADRVQFLQAALWGLCIGAVLSIPISMGMLDKGNLPMTLGMPLAFVVSAGIIFGVSLTIIRRAGQTAGALYTPSGHATPFEPEYSRAAALSVQGDFEGAIAAYREHIAERPDDPEPYLRLARLMRDDLGRYEDAALWFKAGRSRTRRTSRQEVLVTRELIELATDKLQDPLRAAPELARLIKRFPGSPEADWARTELHEVRKQIGDT